MRLVLVGRVADGESSIRSDSLVFTGNFFYIIIVVVMLVNESTIKLGSQLKVLVLGRPIALLHCY